MIFVISLRFRPIGVACGENSNNSRKTSKARSARVFVRFCRRFDEFLRDAHPLSLFVYVLSDFFFRIHSPRPLEWDWGRGSGACHEAYPLQDSDALMAVLALLEEVQVSSIAYRQFMRPLKGTYARGIDLVTIAQLNAMEVTSNQHRG